MISRADIIDLIAATPEPGVSILMPTHVTGTETTQNPIRFANCLATAARELEHAGVTGRAAEELLAPARDLADDHDFWQHQSTGLAVYLDETGMRVHRVPGELHEHVAVGPRYVTAPLLPLLGEGESALVLTVTASSARLYRATRDSLLELTDTQLPTEVEGEALENDYEAPAQASPSARPNTGSSSMSHAQVYGDGPPEWRETLLDDFVQKIERELDRITAADKPPVVLVAGADIIGRLRPSGLLTADVDLNPDALETAELHERAWEALRPTFQEGREHVLDRYHSLAGTGDGRGASELADVRKAASEGRVDALIVPRSSLEKPDDELAELIADTVRTSGSITLVDEDAGLEHPVAVLRY
jgi:hypothetical protein